VLGNYFKTFIKKLAPGVDVMITIFSDLSPFSAKKMALFFLKNNALIIFLHKLVVF
jgi:hypothetical protein